MIGGSVELGAANVRRSGAGSSSFLESQRGRVPAGRYGNLLLFVEPTGYKFEGLQGA